MKKKFRVGGVSMLLYDRSMYSYLAGICTYVSSGCIRVTKKSIIVNISSEASRQHRAELIESGFVHVQTFTCSPGRKMEIWRHRKLVLGAGGLEREKGFQAIYFLLQTTTSFTRYWNRRRTRKQGDSEICFPLWCYYSLLTSSKCLNIFW